jgi:hypothetical protein
MMTLPTTTTAADAANNNNIKPRSLRAHITGPPEEDEYGGILESSTKKLSVKRILVSNVNVSPPASIADATHTSSEDDEFLHDDDDVEEDIMSEEDDVVYDEIVIDRGEYVWREWGIDIL